jgi:hypothetical protein
MVPGAGYQRAQAVGRIARSSNERGRSLKRDDSPAARFMGVAILVVVPIAAIGGLLWLLSIWK